jgi:hypothetical protein
MNARDRSRVEQELAPAARIVSPSPDATDGAESRGGATGFECGAGAYGRNPIGPVASSQSD